MKKLFLLLLIAQSVPAQIYLIVNQEKPHVGYRGLAFINDSSFVVSGSGNMIGKTSDLGKTFQWIQPAMTPERDFRDIEVLSALHYVAMAIDRPGMLIETKDGGLSWQEIYHNDTGGIFLDALFKTRSGDIYALGDPIENGKPFLLRNQAEIQSLSGQAIRLENAGEAFFAASGSNLYVDEKQAMIVSGGVASHLYHYTHEGLKVYALEKGAGSTAGINGLKYDPQLNIGYLTGGDFNKPDDPKGNFFRFTIENGKVVFIKTDARPEGYKTDAAIIDEHTVIVCGYSGVEISKDGGNSWKVITKDSYNVCAVSPDRKTVVLAGAKGKIARITL